MRDPAHTEQHPARDFARRMLVRESVQLEQHQATRVQHVVEAQRLRATAEAPPKRHAVQQRTQRTVEASGAAVLDPAVLVLEPGDPVTNTRVPFAVFTE
jgi:hypothetical protein